MGQSINDKFGGVGPDGVLQTVSNYVQGQSRNRQFTAVGGTVETATWNSGVNEVTITVTLEDAADQITTLGVCFDAPSDATAAAWLTFIESKTADTAMVVLVPNVPRTFYFSGDGITRMDIKRITGTDALGVTVEAA